MEDNKLLERIEEHTRKTEINTRKTTNYVWVIMILVLLSFVGAIYQAVQTMK
ncbi:MAG: hypothetical protein COA33_014500 [Fluviicola sp.]|nr:hypothetical protein [Fluviicola sp.]